MPSTKNHANVLKALPLCCLLALHVRHTAAGLLPLVVPEVNEAPSSSHSPSVRGVEKIGTIAYFANGTLLLRSNTTNDPQSEPELLIFKSAHGALGATALRPANQWNIRIYGDGVEHKFPPFLERIIQRVQSYFSVYKYTDTSRPGQQPVVVVQSGAVSAASNSNSLTTTTQPVATTTAKTTTTTSGATQQTTNALGAEGSGASTLSSSSGNSASIIVHIDAAAGDDDDYTEFIAIGEHDDFITVGDD